ncbi:MAG: hypothetical protein K8S87_08695 [Planctomycetes bacterium]|nr:hypothetical protein [Planctomycetota bacterium]
MSLPFDINNYSIDKLIKIISKKSKITEKKVRRKLHTKYFEEYFKEVGARKIIIENDYIDRDYLEDYSGYYVRCFRPYLRKCTRLHFFNQYFSKNDFNKVLSAEDTQLTTERLNNSYLGFIVIKPLPETVIGRTCLKTYVKENADDNSVMRIFPSFRNYEVNLFGIELSLESLAFQEQDHVVAACATSALWTVFQGTGKLFQHRILSPLEITKIATNLPFSKSRNFPSKGLSIEQMAQAIREVNLEPYFPPTKDEHILKSVIYAYLKANIPLVFGVELVDTSSKPKPNAIKGKHAVAVTGFNLGFKKSAPYKKSNFHLTASKIDKIYVHDDQVGPFARMIFDDYPLKNKKGNPLLSLYTSWKGKDNQIGSMRAIPIGLLMPLYHKIRIPLITIHEIILEFDSIISYTLALLHSINNPKNQINSIQSDIEWDIFLSTVNDLKTELIKENEIKGESLRSILTQSLPRFVWRAIAYSEKQKIIEFIFDATDISQGDLIVQAIIYKEYYLIFFKQIPSILEAFSPTEYEKLQLKPSYNIFKYLIENNN